MIWLPNFLAGATLLLLAGCSSDRQWSEDALPAAQTSVMPGEFFPEAIYSGRDSYGRSPVLDDFHREYFSAALADAEARPLPTLAKVAPEGDVQLRFLWLPSFHSPAVVTVLTTSDGRRRLVAKRIPVSWAADDVGATEQVDRPLTEAESNELEQFLEESQLLQLPARDQRISGLDGSDWVVEAADREHYHLISRWSPEEGPVRMYGALLLRFTGWKLEEIY